MQTNPETCMTKIKKLLLVGLPIGLGQAIAFLMLPILTRSSSEETITLIGSIETSLIWLNSLICLGIQLNLTRLSAMAPTWREELTKAKANMLSFSLALSALGIGIAFIDNGINNTIILVIAPIIALNTDFILYGLDKAATASWLAFIRSSLPSLFIITITFTSNNEGLIAASYVSSIAIAHIISAYFIAITSQTRLIPKAKLPLNFPKYYLASAKLGASSLLLSSQRLLPIPFAAYFYDAQSTTIAYGFFKIFNFYIGGRRLSLQTFYKDIVNSKSLLFLNNSIFSLSIIIAITFYIMSQEISKLLFNQDSQAHQNAIILSALCCVSVSIFATSGTQLLGKQLDRNYLLAHITSFITLLFGAACCIILDLNIECFLLSIVVSEIVLASASKYYLVKSS